MAAEMNTAAEEKTLALFQQVFPDLSPNDIRALFAAAQQQEFSAGENICVEGDAGNSLFIIASGDVDIIVATADGQEILVDTIGVGTYFGEMAFLGETTRLATVRACDVVETWEIAEKDFLSIARTNPSLLRTLLRQIIGHIRRTDRAVINELNVKNSALQQINADLETQERLRTQFIATLSHELRTPLTSIQGYLGLINQGAMQGNALDTALNSITRNVRKLVGHTNDMLLLYEMHPQAPDFEYLNIPDLLVSALNAVQDQVQLEGALPAVRFDIAPDLPQVYADRRGVILASRALLDNAFKFNRDDNPVTIRVQRDGEREVAISIIDQGIGIDAKKQALIFEPFSRLESDWGDRLFPGLGIGLTIAHFVVDRHNGRISLTSTPGAGSTFTIHLPISPEDA
jgi:signal transduction histidine kinase